MSANPILSDLYQPTTVALPVQSTGGPRGQVPAPSSAAQRGAEPAARTATVLVVDPADAFREVLHPALIEHADCRIVYTKTVFEVDEAISQGLQGDLALVSVQLNGNTAKVIRTLRSSGWARIIALTTTGMSVAPVLEAIGAGASGVVSIAGAGIPADPLSPARKLSARELQIVRLVAEGCSNKEIARQLTLSSLTVKNHLARIGRKFGVGDRAHIVAIACRGGVITGKPGPDTRSLGQQSESNLGRIG